MIKDDFFCVGQIVNTQGVKGEVRVVPATDEPSRFSLLKSVFAKTKDGEKRLDIQSSRLHKQFVVLKIAGVDDMDAADRLKWARLYIEPKDALPLGDDEYYERDLFGMAVFDEDGGLLGAIEDIISTGANDVYSVKAVDGNDFLIPAIKQVVLSVDVESKKMVIRLMKGLR